MNISPAKCNNLGFKSKIVFIPSNAFDGNTAKFFYCRSKSNSICDSMVKAADVWTEEIRTCTGGGIVGNGEVLGFHFYDSLNTLNNIKDELAGKIAEFGKNFKSALMIGSKKTEDDVSTKVFNVTLDEIKKVTKPSIFREYTNLSAQSNIKFVSAEDTWFVNTNYLKCPGYLASEEDVKSLESLRKSFKEIQIAPQDRLFIGEKEITRDMCPDIFIQ